MELQIYDVIQKKKRKKQREKKVTEIMKKTIGTKLITYTKKLKLKIQSRVWNFKYTMLNKRRKNPKKTKKQGQKLYIYEVC